MGMEFNYSFGKDAPVAPDPKFDVRYDQTAPKIQADGNLTYLDYIDLVDTLWSAGHPEIQFKAYGQNVVYNPEKGHIVYNLESRTPEDNNAKPRLRLNIDDPDNEHQKIAIFTQSFVNIISFTAVHRDPRTAEEIIEEFENFMIMITPILIQKGLESFFYNRRLSDDMEKRYGDDVSSRTILYRATIQKVLTIEQNKLETVLGEVQVFLQ